MPQDRYPAKPADYTILQDPIHFRNGRIALNRLLKAAMAEKIYSWDHSTESKRGLPNENVVNLYEKLGFGGFGLIITGNMAIDPKHTYEAGQGIVSKENDSPIMREWFAKQSRAIKANNALAVSQLNHTGSWGLTSYTDSKGNKHKISDGAPNLMEVSKEKLKNELIDRVVYASRVLKLCGFDGIQIASAFGNQFCQFLFNNTNNRTDEYGGSLENRTRLMVEIYKNIRQEIPAASGFLVGIKLNSADFQNQYSNDELIQLAEIIESTGFDFIELTGGSMEQTIKESKKRASTIAREDYFFEFTRTFTRVFQKTVVYITGSWQTTEGMVEAIHLGVTNGVGFARAAAAEPNLPRKLLTGSVYSVLYEKFEPSDYGTAKYAAHLHLKKLSQSPISSSASSSIILPDFTDQDEANNFVKAAVEYRKLVSADGSNPDSFASVLTYNSLKN